MSERDIQREIKEGNGKRDNRYGRDDREKI